VPHIGNTIEAIGALKRKNTSGHSGVCAKSFSGSWHKNAIDVMTMSKQNCTNDRTVRCIPQLIRAIITELLEQNKLIVKVE